MRVLLFLTCLFWTGGVFAQGVGTISGRVINSEESPVGNAKVAIYKGANLATFISADANGRFVTEKIDTGIYEVHVVARMHKRSVITKVPVTGGKNTDVEVKLFEKRNAADTVYVYDSYFVPEKRAIN